MAPHLLQLLLQGLDAAADVAAVRFQLGFAGAPGADAAAQPGQALSQPHEPGQEILLLGQLHLEFSLFRAGPLGEDVQD